MLLLALHPDGLRRPRRGSGRSGVHRKHRDPVLDDRCCACRAVFNAFRDRVPDTNRRPSALVLIPRGCARGVATAKRARELGCDRMEPLELKHTVQGHAAAGLDPEPLPDPVVEADECHVNAGENRSAASLAG